MISLRCTLPLAATAVALWLTGCGNSTGTSASAGAPAAGSSAPGAPAAGSASGSGGGAQPLLGEAQSAATGDIPDSQVFLTFHSSAPRYSMQYPEGWAQQGSGRNVTFRNKNNLIHVLVAPGQAPTPGSAAADLAGRKAGQPSLTLGPAGTLTIGGAAVIKLSYSTQSAPNPVTGKRVLLLVDRYLYAGGGRVATLDLATPKGVDNVDAYKKIAHSFRWR